MSRVETFEPGSQINTLGLCRKSAVRCPELKIRFPCRIHMTPIDCNRFGFGKPGGGGLGFAIDMMNTLIISQSSKLQIEANRPKDMPLVLHYFRMMQKILLFEQDFHFNLSVSNLVRQHFGLGSSVSVACAVVFGINKVFGEPLSIEEIRHLIAYNFVEEFKGKIAQGLETGVGTSVILRGGISVIGGKIIEVFHRLFPHGYSVLLIDPKTNRPESDKPESQDMLNRTFFLDTSYRYAKSYNTLMDIIPALYEGDLRTVGDYIWDIQYSGTHLSMIQSYEDFGRKIYETLACLRKTGAEICGLSSVGPAIYSVVQEEKRDQIIQTIHSRLPNVGITPVKPNNQGINEL